MPTPCNSVRRSSIGAALLLVAVAGCSGEPSEREIRNARAFEALLTAVSLRNARELEKDARIIDDRHASDDLSESRHSALQEVISRARAGDWAAAESRAYEFRKEFGDRGAYFK